MAAKRARRKSTAGRSRRGGSGGVGMLPWFAVATVALIVGYDHWDDIRPKALAAAHMAGATIGVPSSSSKPSATAATTPALKTAAVSSRPSAGQPVPPAPIPISISASAAAHATSLPVPSAAPLPLAPPVPASVSESFGLCGEGAHFNCVLDGSTFWVRGVKVRLAGIDTPAIGPARCAEEQRRGLAAKVRLLALLNAGPFTLESGAGGDDKSERQRTALRGGRSIGDALVSEGLAHKVVDSHGSWCA